MLALIRQYTFPPIYDSLHIMPWFNIFSIILRSPSAYKQQIYVGLHML
jgi:hypothetical protein